MENIDSILYIIWWCVKIYLRRTSYMDYIINLIDTEFVKVFIGMRRTGKTQLMLSTIEELKNRGICEDNIIYISLESRKYNHIKTYTQLDEAIYSQIKNTDDRIYIFIDEIQEVEGWEKSINGYRVDLKSDIYITGSNSKLLSTELSTLLTGRYIQIPVYPFSFKEVLEYTELNRIQNTPINEKEVWNKYLEYGGMPSIQSIDDEYVKTNILRDIYNSIIINDILTRHTIKDIDLFKRFLRYHINSTSQTFSKKSISNYLKNENKETSRTTIANFTQYIEEALFSHKVRRNDLMGKKELKTEEKYYLTDHGFHHVIIDDNKKWIPRILENIVYMELLRRGYTIHIGKIKNKEIDFVCEKNKSKIYVQVSYILSTLETVKREFEPLEKVQDNYPKYVLTMDELDFSQNGIIHMNIIDFLKDESI